MKVVLASGSRYRRALLARLVAEFSTVNPAIDEQRRDNEGIRALVERLAREKALAVRDAHPNSLIIGSDQIAAFDHRIIGKPLRHDVAQKQLMQASSKVVRFLTAVVLLDTSNGEIREHVDETEVHFRRLHAAEIERYLRREQPYDCAGSFKSEGLGIALVERIVSEDPTALQGLPLIWVASALSEVGVRVI